LMTNLGKSQVPISPTTLIMDLLKKHGRLIVADRNVCD